MLVHRQNNVLKSVNSSPEFAASYTVYVTPVGARVASAGSGTSTITVDAGHSFAVNDRFLRYRSSDGSTEFSTPIDSAVTATTLVWSSDTWTVSAGDLLVNLGPDTGTGGTPDYDAIPGRISAEPDDGTAVTNNLLTTDSQGNYDYYSRMSGRQWELILDGSGVAVGLVDGSGGNPGEWNIADFGCELDGSTVDSTRVSAAVVSANSQSGMVLHPGGTCLWAAGDSITLSGTNCGLIGRGDQSYFNCNQSTTTAPINVTGTNVILRDFKVLGNRAQTNKAVTISVNGATTVEISNVFVDESGATGMNINNSSYVVVDRCRVDNSHNHGILFGGGTTRSTMRSCLATGCGQSLGIVGALSILGDGGTDTCSIIDCKVYDAKATGIRCGPVGGVFPVDIRVIGNEVRLTGGAASSTEGITFSVDRGICASNIVKTADVSGILVYGAATHVVVANNLVFEASQDGSQSSAIKIRPGLASESGGSMEDVLVIGNMAIDTQGTPTQARVVSVGTSGDDQTLSQCVVVGNMGSGNINDAPVAVNDSNLEPNTFIGDNMGAGSAYSGLIYDFADADATPSVKNGRFFRTVNTGATVITALDDGTAGQVVTIIIADSGSNTDFTHSASLKLSGAADWTTAAPGDSITFAYTGSAWVEISRSDNT